MSAALYDEAVSRRRNLYDDEDIVLSSRAHPFSLLPSVLLPLALLASVISLMVLYPSAPLLVLYVLLGALVLAGVPLVARWLRWRRNWHTITTKRILAGPRRGADILPPVMLSQVIDVSYDQSIWQRLVNTGTVRVAVFGQRIPRVLYSVRSPGQFVAECWRRAYRLAMPYAVPDSPGKANLPTDPESPLLDDPFGMGLSDTGEFGVGTDPHPTGRIATSSHWGRP